MQHLSYVLFVGFVQFHVDSDSYHVKKRMKKIIYCRAFGKWFTFLLCGEGIFVIVTLTLSWMIRVVFHFGTFDFVRIGLHFLQSGFGVSLFAHYSFFLTSNSTETSQNQVYICSLLDWNHPNSS